MNRTRGARRTGGSTLACDWARPGNPATGHRAGSGHAARSYAAWQIASRTAAAGQAAANGRSADSRVPGAGQAATDREGAARRELRTGTSASRRTRAVTSSTSRSAASVMRRIRSPAFEAILQARSNTAKRSFSGRALDGFEGRAKAQRDVDSSRTLQQVVAVSSCALDEQRDHGLSRTASVAVAVAELRSRTLTETARSALLP